MITSTRLNITLYVHCQSSFTNKLRMNYYVLKSKVFTDTLCRTSLQAEESHIRHKIILFLCFPPSLMYLSSEDKNLDDPDTIRREVFDVG